MSQHEKRLILIETPRGHLAVADFWLELLAGRPLALDWTENDLGAELEAMEDAPFDDTIGVWLKLHDAEHRRLMAHAYAL